MWIKLLAGYLLLVNLITFFLYGADKRKARKNAWRIPEKVLLLFAAMGGGLGALMGMLLWHHKTRKWKFRILVPVFLLLWTAAIAFIIWKGLL